MRALSVPQDTFGFIISFLAAAAAIVILSPAQVLVAFIVLGQGHFLMTYLYQWRGRKMTRSYLIAYAGAWLLLFSAAFLRGFTDWVIVFTGTLFAIHFFVDEYRMARIPFSIGRACLGIAFVLPYGAYLAWSVTGFNVLTYSLVAALLYLCVGVVFVLYHRARLDFVAILAVLGTPLFLWHSAPPPEYLLGFIILFHYVRWYWYYVFILAHEPARRTNYLRDVVVINTAVIALYGLFILGVEPLRYLFEPNFFYLWTILHILFSYVPSFVALFRLSDALPISAS